MKNVARLDVMQLAVALIRRSNGDILLVRKAGTSAYMQPGGKIEPGEDPKRALVRELDEELAISVEEKELTYRGKASARAANEPGVYLDAEIYEINLDDEVYPRGEIDETVWIDPRVDSKLKLAPLTQDHILPMTRWGQHERAR